VRPDVWRNRRAQVRVEYKALTHRGVKRAHVPPGLIDVLDHELAHQLDIAATRGGQQAPVRGNVGVAELLRGRAARLTTDDNSLVASFALNGFQDLR
jgi:hypothetical protein